MANKKCAIQQIRDANLAASVHQRLLNASRETGDDPNLPAPSPLLHAIHPMAHASNVKQNKPCHQIP
ncbi:MAG: hypothetical protein PHV34_13730 [Verrucomicrobiae bacterium]|nr:hypothetical protein [Verrucomicrobiae bacterium]